MPADKRMDAEEPASERRAPYSAPRLVVYGSLADITRAVGNTSNKDGGTGFMKRSQP